MQGSKQGDRVYSDAGQDRSGCGLIGRDWIWDIFVLDFGRAFEFVLAPGLRAADICMAATSYIIQLILQSFDFELRSISLLL